MLGPISLLMKLASSRMASGFLMLSVALPLLACSFERKTEPFTPEHALRLGQRSDLRLATKPDPPFLLSSSNPRSIPPGKVGVGTLFNQLSMLANYQDAVDRGKKLRLAEYVRRRTKELLDQFVSGLHGRLDLTTVTVLQLKGDAENFMDSSAILRFTIREWGLYVGSDDRYRVQLIGEANLIEHGQTRWRAMCVQESDPAHLPEWIDSGATQLSSKVDQLVKLCSEDFIQQFPL